MNSNRTKEGGPREKIRRVTTACDNCRNKKVRCDGPHMTGNRCSICLASGIECTYFRVAKKRGPPKEYVTTLETRLSEMERLLKIHRPDIDISKELNKSDEIMEKEPLGSIGIMQNPAEPIPFSPELSTIEDQSESSDYESAMVDVSHETRFVNYEHEKAKYFGKSSSVGLFRAVMDAKQQHWAGFKSIPNVSIGTFASRRRQFWEPDPYASIMVNIKPNYEYPEPKLLYKLVDTYFREVNIFMPILHRPTFENAVGDGLHLRDAGFGSLLLVVCAVATTFSNGEAFDYATRSSRVSPWFLQVQRSNQSILGPVRLYDVQMAFLSSVYLLGLCPPESAWLIAGVGIRMCQDVGAHRRKGQDKRSTLERELWKRVFWGLVFIERWMSCGFGRPCTLREEDCDLDYPAECDDEYWFHPEQEKAFKQPSGKPSYVSYFIAALKQSRLLGCVLRTLYSSHKSKTLFNILSPEREQIVVAELDSALNKWLDDVPEFLKWDPSRPNSMFTRQSAHLYANYYHLQILVHRPFITAAKKSSAFPSLTICTNAARSCLKVLSVLHFKYHALTNHTIMPMFTSAIVLLVNIWGKTTSDQEQDLAILKNCIEMLTEMEKGCFPASHMKELLVALGALGKLYERTDITLQNFKIHGSDGPSIHMSGTDESSRLPRGSSREMSSMSTIHVSFGKRARFADKKLSCRAQSPPSSATDDSDALPLELPMGDMSRIVEDDFPSQSSDAQFCQRLPTISQAPENPMDSSVYREMMTSIDSALEDKFVPDDFLPSTPATAQYLSNSDSHHSQLGYQPPQMSVEDAFDFINTAPAPMVWDEWDSYVVDLMNRK